jgi:hypothetical protein
MYYNYSNIESVTIICSIYCTVLTNPNMHLQSLKHMIFKCDVEHGSFKYFASLYKKNTELDIHKTLILNK